MHSRLAAALLATLVSAGTASAAPATTATPKTHGILDILPARGTIDPDTGSAKLRLERSGKIGGGELPGYEQCHLRR